MKKNQVVENALDKTEKESVELYDRLVNLRESIDYKGIWSVKETYRCLGKSIEELEQCLNTMKTTPSK